jgi:hypothetical protein
MFLLLFFELVSLSIGVSMVLPIHEITMHQAWCYIIYTDPVKFSMYVMAAIPAFRAMFGFAIAFLKIVYPPYSLSWFPNQRVRRSWFCPAPQLHGLSYIQRKTQDGQRLALSQTCQLGRKDFMRLVNECSKLLVMGITRQPACRSSRSSTI